MTNRDKMEEVFGPISMGMMTNMCDWLEQEFDGPEQLTINIMAGLNEDENGVLRVVHEDEVNEPEHYKHSTYEAIDEMLIVFGVEKTLAFCELSAWKYRNRAAYKGNFEQDMAKADRYVQMARDIREANGMYVSLIKRSGNAV